MSVAKLIIDNSTKIVNTIISFRPIHWTGRSFTARSGLKPSEPQKFSLKHDLPMIQPLSYILLNCPAHTSKPQSQSTPTSVAFIHYSLIMSIVVKHRPNNEIAQYVKYHKQHKIKNKFRFVLTVSNNAAECVRFLFFKFQPHPQ